jgi:hypothetical protein
VCVCVCVGVDGGLSNERLQLEGSFLLWGYIGPGLQPAVFENVEIIEGHRVTLNMKSQEKSDNIQNVSHYPAFSESFYRANISVAINAINSFI